MLRVGSDPGGKGSREVTAVPIEDEFSLRNRAWMDDNRRKVDQMSGGRVAYVYLPNTAEAGYTNFNRYYFAQVGKEAAVIDERFNGGGDVADDVRDHQQATDQTAADELALDDQRRPETDQEGQGRQVAIPHGVRCDQCRRGLKIAYVSGLCREDP